MKTTATSPLALATDPSGPSLVEEALMDLSRKNPILKNRVPEHVERAVIERTIQNPTLGHKCASRELQKTGVMVASSGVRAIWSWKP